MKTRNLIPWMLLLLLPLGFAGACRLQKSIDSRRAALHEEQDEMILRSGRVLKAMSLEYAPLMAHIYWTRAVQYYGDKQRKHEADLATLWPLLDATTTLDPQLLVAYRFGSTFLSEARPRGAGRPDLAVQLLERGIQENPEAWRFYQDLGNVYYFDMKDYQKASDAFLEGSKRPGAQFWMKTMAAKIAAEGESPETSIFLWKDIYETSNDPKVKKNAEAHLQMVQTQLACRKIDALAEQMEKRTGRRPRQTNELVQAGLLQHEPADPMGYKYVFGADGKAQLNPDSPLLELLSTNPSFRQ
jgi:hypothetical protein